MKNKPVLLVVDVQNAFYGLPGVPPVHCADGMLSRIGSVLSNTRAHSVPMIFVQHETHEGHPLEPETEGWELHASLDAADVSTVRKTRPDAFFETDLKARLDALEASHLVILGNQTEFCVDTTCRRAVSEGYTVTLISDCHSTWPNDVLPADKIIAHHNFVLGRQFVQLVTADALDWASL